MSSDGLGKVLYYLQPKKQCLFMGVFAKVPLVIFMNVCQRVCCKKELSKLRQEINRVGVNINQIARQVNTNEEASREELVAVLEKLQEIEELIEGKIEEAEKGE